MSLQYTQDESMRQRRRNHAERTAAPPDKRVASPVDGGGPQAFGSFTASLFGYPAVVERVVTAGWATAEELAEMALAWTEWGAEPGAFVARFWCEAVGWVD